MPLGGVVMSEKIARAFDDRVYPGGLFYSGHPLACAVGDATFRVFERDSILDHIKDLCARVVRPEFESWFDRPPCLGEVRGTGLFWALELVRNQEACERLVPFNAVETDAAPMAELAVECNRAGLWRFVHFNRMHIAPQPIIAEEDLRRGLSIINKVLDIADSYAV